MITNLVQARHEYHVHNYRLGNLVYCATPKCASTFYSTLVLANGWQRINWSQIDWNQDHVFGFYAEPVDRWYKAIQEDIQNEERYSFSNLIYDQLENHADRCFPVTFHSLPITSALGAKAYDIDWIPLLDHTSNVEQFMLLCAKYNITIQFDDTVDRHVSSGQKMHDIVHIKRVFGHGDPKWAVWYLHLANDIELWQNICEKFNSHATIWDNMSWLRND